MTGMCREKTSCLFYLGAEKIAFPYFYITAFCSLTDRLKLTWLWGTIHASNRERPEKFRISENNKVIYFSLKFP